MTAPRDELAALLARVEAATGASEELDKAVWYKLVLDPELDKPGDGYLKLIGQRPWSYTASIDRALALVDRMLPGCIWTIERDLCTIRVLSGDDVAEFNAGRSGKGGKWTALAVIASLLTALLQSEAGQGDGAGENLVHHHG